jgi:hypothetical protein
LNFERELACDERVVNQTANPKHYARCLTRAAEVRGARHQTALGSALFGAAGQLPRRVDRLLAMRDGKTPRLSRMVAIGGACAIAVAAVQLRTLPAVAEIGEVIVPAVAMTSRLIVSSGAAPVEAPASTAESQSVERPLRPISTLGSRFENRELRTENREPIEASKSDAILAEEVPIATMADIAYAAYHEVAPFRNEPQPNVRLPEPVPPDAPAQPGPLWRRFERAGVGIGGAFANFGQSVARRF